MLAGFPGRDPNVARRRVAAVLAVVLVLDRITKAVVAGAMQINQSVPVLGDWFRLTYIRNTGVAFGLFPGQRTSFIILSVAGLAAVGYYLARRAPRDGREVLSLGLFIGGALGNLVDRVRFGEVIDFLDFGVRAHRFPVFNVADMGVTCGVALLVASAVFPRDRSRSDEAPSLDLGASRGGG